MSVVRNDYYNPLDIKTLENPYPIYDQLRTKRPVFFHEGMKSWVLSRYSDCKEVLANNDAYAMDLRRIGKDVPRVSQNLQSLDPPDNKGLRSLILQANSKKDKKKFESNTREFIDKMFFEVRNADEFDFMRRISAPLSLRITCELLGVPEPDLFSYLRISDDIAHQMDGGLNPDYLEPGNEARKKLNIIVEQWFSSQSEDEGIIHYLRNNREKANVPEHYVRNSAAVMFNASFGTLYAALGNVIKAIIENPWILDELKGANDKLYTSAANELVRYDGPAQGTSRFAVEDTTINGVKVNRGDIVLTLLAAANRDPEKFYKPHNIILDRQNNSHLGFGWGPHVCIGGRVGQIVIKELIKSLQELPPIKITRTPERRYTATVRCIDVLPLTLKA